MNELQASNLGKNYNYTWIFRQLSFNVSLGESVAIIGPNGSGKSTLLQILSGYTSPSEGQVHYYQTKNSTNINEQLHKYVGFVSPATELIEELTLTEFLEFHNRCNPLTHSKDISWIIETIQLRNFKGTYIKQFSSGMKQRLKLGIVLLSEKPFLFLDEPTVNLDNEGVDWYLKLVENYQKDRIVVIASNDPREYSFAHKRINISDYKT